MNEPTCRYLLPNTLSPQSSMNVTSLLDYCKRKILNPYLRLLSLVGLRPLIVCQQEPNIWLRLVNNSYTFILVLLLIVGYFLQYMACFRRDRGFCYIIVNNTMQNNQNTMQNQLHLYEQICHGPLVFSFLIPNILHFLGFVHALAIMRHSDDDQLPVLMERVFLSSSTIQSQRKLVKTLWIFVAITALWMALSMVAVNTMMANGNITFKWIESRPHIATRILKIVLVVCTLSHDIVHASIISNYCLQTQLLTIYLQFLSEKLLHHPIQPIDWIRYIETFKKMLDFINNKIAPSVCFFTFMNSAFALSGLLWLFNFDNVDSETVPIVGISTLNVVLWIALALAPFIQAARLSNECDILRKAGQEIKTRPFVHQDTPGYELDSILLYTFSLKLRAKLFWIPITGKYLCISFMLAGICLLVLGQCHYLNFNLGQ